MHALDVASRMAHVRLVLISPSREPRGMLLIQICQVPGSLGEGSIKGLVDEDLLEDGGGEQDGSTCLEPSADGIEADSSYVNVSFLEEVDTCGVYGEGFYANISREELRGDDVTGISRPVAVLGGVFLRPNETSRLLGELQLSISSPQVGDYSTRLQS